MSRHLYPIPSQLLQNSLWHLPLDRRNDMPKQPRKLRENANANPRCPRLLLQVLLPFGPTRTKSCFALLRLMKNRDSHGKSSPESWASLNKMSERCGTRSRTNWVDLDTADFSSWTSPIADEKSALFTNCYTALGPVNPKSLATLFIYSLFSLLCVCLP